MKWNFKRDIFALALLGIFIIIDIFFYFILPQTVPSHFNSSGLPNAYSSKLSFVLISASVPVALYFLVTFIPFIDPLKKKFGTNFNIFFLLRDFIIGLIVFVMILALISAKDGVVRTDLFGLGIGILLVLIGNYLPKLPRNFFFGIRSPWTLASNIVWYRTHRISGALFVIGGLLLIVLNLFKVNVITSLTIVLIPLLGFTAFIYPYFLYRKLQKEEQLNNPNL